MIYDIVTFWQFLIACCSFFLIAALTGSRRRMTFTTTCFVALLLFFIGLDQLWWTMARSAFADSGWVVNFIPQITGLDAKIWFEKSEYVLIFKSGILASLVGLIIQAVRPK